MTIDLTGVLEDGSKRAASVPTDARQTLTLLLGGDVTIRLLVLGASGSPVDLTGAAFTLTARKRLSDVQAALSLSGTVMTAQGLGRVDFSVTPAALKSLSAGTYAYDVWMTQGGLRDAVIPLSPLVVIGTATDVP